MFSFGPNILGQTKNWIVFSGSSKSFVPVQNQIYWMEIIFWCGKKSLGPAQYENQFLERHKKFGRTQWLIVTLISDHLSSNVIIWIWSILES